MALGWRNAMRLLFGKVAHVILAGDGGGNQRGPAFLQQVDGALGFGGEGVELGGFGFDEVNDRL